MDMYVQKDGQRQGPFSELELREAVAAGRFAPNDFVSLPGDGSAHRLSAVLASEEKAVPIPHANGSNTNFRTVGFPMEAVQKRGRAYLTTGGIKVAAWFSAAFSSCVSSPNVSGQLWNPLTIIGWSLLLTPAFGSALVYLNWMRLGRVKRARITAVWFWASLAWLAFSTVASPIWRPPLWAYLVFLGAWVGLVAYPQHLSFTNRFVGTGYRRAPWPIPVAVGILCLLPFFVLHAAFARLYQPPVVVSRSAPIAAVVTATPTPAPDEATRLFSAEEITQRYRARIVEVVVAWKETSGMWFWKSEHSAGSQGSGLLLANDSTAGLIITNFHVVAAPDEAVAGSYECGVRQDTSQSSIEASCIARAKPPLDLALLAVKMNAKEWKPDAVRIQALDNLRQGEAVVAIGNALGEGISTTNGVISHFDALDSQGHGCIRTSAPISPGNSGGPLFTTRGGVFAGITTATRTEAGAQNYNMAIPAEYVLEPDNWEFANPEERQMAEPLLKAAAEREHR